MEDFIRQNYPDMPEEQQQDVLAGLQAMSNSGQQHPNTAGLKVDQRTGQASYSFDGEVSPMLEQFIGQLGVDARQAVISDAQEHGRQIRDWTGQRQQESEFAAKQMHIILEARRRAAQGDNYLQMVASTLVAPQPGEEDLSTFHATRNEYFYANFIMSGAGKTEPTPEPETVTEPEAVEPVMAAQPDVNDLIEEFVTEVQTEAPAEQLFPEDVIGDLERQIQTVAQALRKAPTVDEELAADPVKNREMHEVIQSALSEAKELGIAHLCDLGLLTAMELQDFVEKAKELHGGLRSRDEMLIIDTIADRIMTDYGDRILETWRKSSGSDWSQSPAYRFLAEKVRPASRGQRYQGTLPQTFTTMEFLKFFKQHVSQVACLEMIKAHDGVLSRQKLAAQMTQRAMDIYEIAMLDHLINGPLARVVEQERPILAEQSKAIVEFVSVNTQIIGNRLHRDYRAREALGWLRRVAYPDSSRETITPRVLQATPSGINRVMVFLKTATR